LVVLRQDVLLGFNGATVTQELTGFRTTGAFTCAPLWSRLALCHVGNDKDTPISALWRETDHVGRTVL